jgi:L-ascorbate peroxidase
MKIACASLLLAAIASGAQAFAPSPRAPLGGRIATPLSVTKAELSGAESMIDGILREKNCGPVFVRLAWHDSGTYDVNIGTFPQAGGAIGSIRFSPEVDHGANAGLAGAVRLLEPVKEAYPGVSYADIFQMASARAIALAGGPSIDMKYGRVDATGPEECSPEGNLPDAEAGPGGKFGGAGGTAPTEDAAVEWHLRKVFYRMGLGDEEIVALSGAHTFGRAYADRSGLGAEKTKFTDGSAAKLADGSTTTSYTPGGSPWVENWLVFDNSYFTTINDATTDEELLKLTSDKILFKDAGFKPFAMKFAASQDDFFESYAKAHKKLSELGSKFETLEEAAGAPVEAAAASA